MKFLFFSIRMADSKHIKNLKERERVERKNRSLDELRNILMSQGFENGRRWTELDTLEKTAELVTKLEDNLKKSDKALPPPPLHQK